MSSLNFHRRTFMPSFPIKSQISSNSSSKKSNNPIQTLKISPKQRQDLFSLTSDSYSSSFRYKNQINFCEVRETIMSPIKLTNLQISLPDYSGIISQKSRPRRSLTMTSKRKSNESKSFYFTMVKIPSEIMTQKYEVRGNTAKIEKYDKKAEKRYIFTANSGFEIRLKRGSRETSQEGLNSRKNFNEIRKKPNENSSSASPQAYSPIYNSKYDTL